MSIDKPIERRSTGALTAKKIKPVIDALETSKAAYDYDLERTKRNGRPKFSCVQMLVILFFIEIKKYTFATFHAVMDGRNGQRILKDLRMPLKEGRYIYPSDGWISEFRNKEYPLFRDELMSEIQKMVLGLKLTDNVRITVDSTPLEASRYSECADFNPHYMIRMWKAHIVMIEGTPLYHTITNGNCNDCPEYIKLLENFDGVKVSGASLLADGGYDSFESYGETYLHTGCILNGNPGVNAVIHKEAEWANIIKTYNKLYKNDDFVPQNMTNRDKIIRFLAKHGKGELVGKFFRNLDISRGKKLRKIAAKRRHICETMHHAMKRWIDFDIIGLHSKFIERRVSLKVIFCTFLSLLFKPYDN